VAKRSEEYLDSEKYEVKTRGLDGPLLPLVARLNAARRANPALQRLENLTFLETRNNELVAYAKRERGNVILVCVNLDPRDIREGLVTVAGDLALPSSFAVADLLSDVIFTWTTGDNYVRLGPGQSHLLRVEQRQ
jgi:starch synthase (maltosyl-transferring)